ncbi:cytochrome-c oxidase, cbb3-type subunit III [Pseudooceanicola sp. CBS1P-1]|uniref:Cbb3-type cytochrome c oxidase subunit n=1 Tax=Pseudooceanicola albus TaxID=2692189 RepID=A0A6L7G9V0_9RHOB|nr:MULTISPECIES: cytochrome-c oxidase, cbb3-type subunit III [Pseudooceanicola]MBT9386380.1 cytochrome-c oxidase, cbb3-type subunit III [Pseudooceanicola endophyticus]MXN20462.1 cytochrome-c oxidase, cbb3-type subunit III [Pseudooceanicola albus]
MSDDLKEKHGTTGHSWDGIEELNTPLPRWWLWTFYACIFWGICYSIAMPAWPLIKGATPGILGFSTRGEVAERIAEVESANAGINAQLAAADLTQIPNDPQLNGYAVSAGAAVFKTWCAQCHGSGAAGAVGFPNLLDDDWLWGGSIQDVYTTITHGIRNETDPEARYSQMPAFGTDGLLEEGDIDAVVNYVMSLSEEPRDATLVPRGAEVFAENCVTCHGENAKGLREQGAPNLTDAIWLYGGDYATIRQTVEKARFGVMPAWGQRLSEAQVRAVATYVHQLGGGE